MLIKRQVIQQAGLFDEVFGMGIFEDADLSKKAKVLGYLSVCARAAYVFHRERRSFIKHKRFDQNFEKNRQIFFARWGKTERILYVLTKQSAPNAEKTVAEALRTARDGHIVWFLIRAQIKKNIQKHSNIYTYCLPNHFFGLVSLWRILKRKKKFDKIYVDDQDYRETLNKFKSFHKAEVIYAE